MLNFFYRSTDFLTFSNVNNAILNFLKKIFNTNFPRQSKPSTKKKMKQLIVKEFYRYIQQDNC